MKREELKELGLEDEVIDKVMALHGKAVGTHKTNSDKLTTDLETKTKEHNEALALIEKLKSENAGNEKLQNSVKEYDAKVAQLQAENEQLKVDSELKIMLLENKAKAADIDYLMFKLKQGNKEIKLDENGKIKDADNIVSGLKTSYANNFEGEQKKTYEPNKLPDGKDVEKQPQNLLEALTEKYTTK